MPGRKHHDFWVSGEFKVLKINNKIAAFCSICNKTLKNTSKQRLLMHRNVCRKRDVENEEQEHTEIIYFKIQKDTNNNDEESNAVNDEDDLTMEIKNIDEVEKETQDPTTSLRSEVLGVTHEKNTYENTACASVSTASTVSFDDIIIPSATESSSTSRSPFLMDPGKDDLHQIAKKSFVNRKFKNQNQHIKGIQNFLDSITTNQKEKIDKALGTFILGCNIPFHVVDSVYFKNLMHELRPAYTSPCSRTISSTILNKIYEDVVKEDTARVQKHSVMLIDGWKNSANNTKQIVTILTSVYNNRYVFLESYDITGNAETGEELNEICNRSINLAKIKYNTEVYAVVSDNAANMLKMGRLATTLIHTTCSSHTGNLLAKDIIPKNVSSKVMVVLKEFKHPDLEKKLQDSGGSKIKLAVETRWCSYRDSFQCLINNLRIMKRLAAEDNIKIKAEVIQLLFDEDFIEEVQRLIEISEPVCKLINDCQLSNCSAADAAEKWLHLGLPEEFLDILNKRKKMALNVYSLTANFLHPVYKGKSLNEEQTDQVLEFLMETLSGDGLTSLHEFSSTLGIFKILEGKHICCPKTYWGLAERKHPELFNLAHKLLNIPASSAELERVFSNWSFVHNDLRNRLDPEKSKKMVHCYYSLKINEKDN